MLKIFFNLSQEVRLRSRFLLPLLPLPIVARAAACARSNHGLLSRLFRLPLTLFQGGIAWKYWRGLEKIAEICGTNKNVFNDALVDLLSKSVGVHIARQHGRNRCQRGIVCQIALDSFEVREGLRHSQRLKFGSKSRLTIWVRRKIELAGSVFMASASAIAIAPMSPTLLFHKSRLVRVWFTLSIEAMDVAARPTLHPDFCNPCIHCQYCCLQYLAS